MIVERLFTRQLEVNIPLCKPVLSREFTAVEENAIYYAAGYTVRKLIRKYKQNDDQKSREFVNTLHDMLGEDERSTEAHTSYMDYVKVWTQNNDRGGLIHVSMDTFRCFEAIELVTHDLIKQGCTKEEVMSQACINESVRLYFSLISDVLNDEESFELLTRCYQCLVYHTRIFHCWKTI